MTGYDPPFSLFCSLFFSPAKEPTGIIQNFVAILIPKVSLKNSDNFNESDNFYLNGGGIKRANPALILDECMV